MQCTLGVQFHFQAWCKENFIHIRNMNTVLSVRQQLCDLCERVGVAITSYGAECSEPLRKALLGGLFTNVAEHRGEGRYHTVRDCLNPSFPLIHIVCNV